jgi:Glucodextranase, domain B/PASTA domain
VPLAATALLLVVMALAGCGEKERPPADPPPVRLTIEAPPVTATVKDDKVEVRGRVSPARTSVEVQGRSAAVSGGAFSATVALDEGVNVVDVSATMPGRSSAFAALRVTYDPRVTVPDLAGVQDDRAADRIAALGLDPKLESIGGLFDELRSGPRRVCESDPPAGSVVDPGSSVTLRTAKSC